MSPMIAYHDLTLTLSDALDADKLDARHGYERPMMAFDLGDVVRLMLQDEIYDATGKLPDMYARWRADVEQGVTQLVAALRTEAADRYVRAAQRRWR